MSPFPSSLDLLGLYDVSEPPDVDALPHPLPPLATRYEGMPGTMQGGYVASIAAGDRTGPIRVRIRRPLRAGDLLERTVDGDTWGVHRTGELVMVGAPTTMHVSDPGPLDLATALDAARQPLPFDPPFPACVGCGDRPDSLGLRIRPMPAARRMVAAWTPAGSGVVPRSDVWTVTDCITSWCVFVDPPTHGGGSAVTGNIAMQFLADLEAGRTYLYQSWRERDDGRSIICGGAIHDTAGNLVALADQELVRVEGNGMKIPDAPLC
jgi:hypothetical protein